jgi:hypothetical protein
LTEETDVYFGFYLHDPEELKKFINCYSSFQSDVIISTKYKNLELKVNKNLFEEIRKINKTNKSKEVSYLIETYNKVTTQKFNRSIYFKTLKKLNKSKSMIGALLKAYIYLKAANPVRAERILNNLMKKEFLEHIVGSGINGFPLNEQVKISRFLLRNLKNDFGDSEVIDVLIYYLYSNTSGVYREMLDEEFSIDTSISYIRKKYRSTTFGLPYPYVWLPSIFQKGSNSELRNRIDAFSFFSKTQLKDPRKLLFFRAIKTINPADKEKIIKSFLYIQNSKNVYDQFVFIRLLEDEDFYRYVKANTKLNTGLLLNKKRKLFRSLLIENQAVSLGVIYLLAMGDYDIQLTPPLF